MLEPSDCFRVDQESVSLWRGVVGRSDVMCRLIPITIPTCRTLQKGAYRCCSSVADEQYRLTRLLFRAHRISFCVLVFCHGILLRVFRVIGTPCDRLTC